MCGFLVVLNQRGTVGGETLSLSQFCGHQGMRNCFWFDYEGISTGIAVIELSSILKES